MDEIMASAATMSKDDKWEVSYWLDNLVTGLGYGNYDHVSDNLGSLTTFVLPEDKSKMRQLAYGPRSGLGELADLVEVYQRIYDFS